MFKQIAFNADINKGIIYTKFKNSSSFVIKTIKFLHISEYSYLIVIYQQVLHSSRLKLLGKPFLVLGFA